MLSDDKSSEAFNHSRIRPTNRSISRSKYVSQYIYIYLGVSPRESQRSANPSWQWKGKRENITEGGRYRRLALIRKGRLGDPISSTSTMVSVPPRGQYGVKNRIKTCKCCYVKIDSGNVSCDQCCCFCLRTLRSAFSVLLLHGYVLH